MTTKKDIPSILLIGVGEWGERHLRTWLKLEAEGLCRLAGVCDTDKKRLQFVSKLYGVRTFSDIQKALDIADAADVVVTTDGHFKIAKKALHAGKDVFVEKPLTETVAQAQELDAISKNSSKILMVGHIFRYNPAVEYAKKLISDKEIGDIRFLRGRFMGFRFKERGAGILAALAIHFIYLSSFFMGKSPKAVWANTNYLLDDELDDHSFIRIDYGPQFSTIESDYFTPGKWRTFDIIGTHGAIFLDALDQKVELHQKKHIKNGGHFEALDGTVIHPTIEFKEPLYAELKHFLNCVKKRTEPLTGAKDGIEVLKVIEAAYKSSQADKTIPLTIERIKTRKQK